MDERERQKAQHQLALLKWVLTAHERRHDVVDLVWDSADRKQAAVRLRNTFDIEDGDPLVVLDMPMHRFTKEDRDRLAAQIRELRELLASE